MYSGEQDLLKNNLEQSLSRNLVNRSNAQFEFSIQKTHLRYKMNRIFYYHIGG